MVFYPLLCSWKRREYDKLRKEEIKEWIKAEIKKLKIDDWFYRPLFAIRWQKQIYPEIWERKEEIKKLKEERKKGKELKIEELIEPKEPKEMYMPAEKYINTLKEYLLSAFSLLCENFLKKE